MAFAEQALLEQRQMLDDVSKEYRMESRQAFTAEHARWRHERSEQQGAVERLLGHSDDRLRVIICQLP